jgi:DinB superfamily
VSGAELEPYIRQIETIQNQARELAHGLNEAQFNWRPAPDQWSIEECLSHLTMVGQWEVQAIEQAIKQGRARGLTGSGPFEYGGLDRLIVDLTRPPVRMRLPAPRRFVPLHGQPVTAILPTFLHVQSQFLLQMERAEGLDLRRVKVATPISRFLKLSLGMMFAQAAAHEQRHMEQAWRVREKLPR